MPADATPLLDAEKLVVYHVALELQLLCAQVVPVEHRVLRDQLEWASLSVVLNISERAGRHSRKEKRRFYSIARGSTMESMEAAPRWWPRGRPWLASEASSSGVPSGERRGAPLGATLVYA